MGSRRRFTRDFKISVVQQLGSRTAAEICRENEIQQNLLCRWKKEYESNPGVAFQGNGKLWKEQATIARYERLIGQLYAEIDLLKKSLERIAVMRAQERQRRSHTV